MDRRAFYIVEFNTAVVTSFVFAVIAGFVRSFAHR
jgi:hypothetical protein